LYLDTQMKHFLFLLFFLAQIVVGQKVTEVSKIPLVVDTFIGIDAYNNSYVVKRKTLEKKGQDGTFVFNDFLLGEITSVDIINPLKVVVFYEDTNTVVLLDNKLSEMERISFNNLPQFVNISSASNAGNNSLWIFNVDTQQLELYNYRSGRTTIVSQPFEGKLKSQASNFNYCFMLTETKIRTYNIYGSILSEIDINGLNKIVQQNEKLLAVGENQLLFFSENTIKPLNIPIPENKIKDLQLTQDFLYIYDGNFLHTFSITQPKK